MAKQRSIVTPSTAALTVKRANITARLAAVLRAEKQRLVLKLADALAAGSPRTQKGGADVAELRRKLAERRRQRR